MNKKELTYTQILTHTHKHILTKLNAHESVPTPYSIASIGTTNFMIENITEKRQI